MTPDQSRFIPPELTQGSAVEPAAQIRGVPEADRDNLIPLAAHYDLVHFPNEAASVARLSPLVTVDASTGAARLYDDTIKVTTSLVAVQIKDNEASVLPFATDEQGELLSCQKGWQEW